MSSTGASGSAPRVLVYGYGNPGRQDDGAGIAVVDALEAWARDEDRPWLSFDRNYQLNAEDALTASGSDVVIFVDATRDQEEGFLFRQIQATRSVAFSTHAMGPESVLALCRDLYGRVPHAFLLTIRGYQWEPNEPMTPEARENCARAHTYLAGLLDDPRALGGPGGR